MPKILHDSGHVKCCGHKPISVGAWQDRAERYRKALKEIVELCGFTSGGVCRDRDGCDSEAIARRALETDDE